MGVLSENLREIYEKMLTHFGPQKWWPADSPFEVCVGAILTQNASWSNVAKAIQNLKNANLMSFDAMFAASDVVIAECVRPVGYFNLKTKRLRSFLNVVRGDFGNLEKLSDLAPRKLRETLLAIPGIGPETADSMALYAFSKPVFVVDAYTKRILVRHRLIDDEADYYRLQELFEDHLEADVTLFNEYHALFVRTGNQLCKKANPKCEECPLRDVNGGPSL